MKFIFLSSILLSTFSLADIKPETLRVQTMKCAAALEMTQPSHDFAVLQTAGKDASPYVMLFHEKGSYVLPLNKEDFKNGSLKVAATFQEKDARTETLFVTGTFEKEDLSDLTLRVTKAPFASPDSRIVMNTGKEEETFVNQFLIPYVSGEQRSQIETAMSSFPMKSIVHDKTFLKEVAKVEGELKKDQEKGLAKYIKALEKAYTRNAASAADSVTTKLDQTINAMKVCERVENDAIQKAARAAGKALKELKTANARIKPRFVAAVESNIANDVISKADLNDFDQMDGKAQKYMTTLYFALRNGERQIQDALKPHNVKPVQRGLASEAEAVPVESH